MGGPPVQVTYKGKTYRSALALAKEYGVGEDRLRKLIRLNGGVATDDMFIKRKPTHRKMKVDDTGPSGQFEKLAFTKKWG